MNDRYYSAEVTEAIAKERDELRVERDRLQEALRECETIRSLPHAYPGNPGVSQNVLSEQQVRTSREAALQDLVQDAEEMGVYKSPTENENSTDYEKEPNATTKAAMEAADRGEVEEMSDEERQALGFPASRAELVETLRELYSEHYRYYDPFSEKELFNRIRNILTREEL